MPGRTPTTSRTSGPSNACSVRARARAVPMPAWRAATERVDPRRDQELRRFGVTRSHHLDDRRGIKVELTAAGSEDWVESTNHLGSHEALVAGALREVRAR